MRPGQHFNLDQELRTVRDRYFPGLEANIRWGKDSGPRRRKRRSIRMGSWDEEKKRIRIHPALDQDWIPVEYLHYLIYHELCHAVARPVTSRRGNQIHHAEFHALEGQYPDIARMKTLGRKIFERLIEEGK
jgi:hypothetical protein